MSARRCIHTGLSLPECSCLSCNREKVRRFAPHLIARPAARSAVASNPGKRPKVGGPR